MLNGTNDKYIEKIVQNESHDWLGEAAENYVRYVLAHEGFIVFAGSKWGADCAVYHPSNPNKWWRIEVRSTNKNKRPLVKSKEKIKKIADLVVEVRFLPNSEGHTLEMKLYRVLLDGGYKEGSCISKTENQGRIDFSIALKQRNISILDYLQQ